MRIIFYAPFKPIGHPNPSGDLIIAAGLVDFLRHRGHDVCIASTMRSRWLFLKPWLLPEFLRETGGAMDRTRAFAPDIWLSYHSYYKAPDLLGPDICRKLQIPYALFQPIYSTKRRRSLKTAPGFYLNRKALLQAGILFSNRKNDLKNLQRLIPQDRLHYIRPGIFPDQFRRDSRAGNANRHRWGVEDCTAILTAAMFRPDVKTEGLLYLIKSLGKLGPDTGPFKLIVAGDGKERGRIESAARLHLGDRVIFTGKIAREQMYRFYSGGDIFAFPGIRESLGMVFLEAQSCGLPVIAFNNGGIPEVVKNGHSGILTPPFVKKDYRKAIKQLLQDRQRRDIMGARAAEYVRTYHDLDQNYLHFEELLSQHARTFKK